MIESLSSLGSIQYDMDGFFMFRLLQLKERVN